MATRTDDPYCAEEDFQLGDLQTPREVTIEDFIKDAADEIDAVIGQIYQLPLNFDMSKSQDRADKLLMKKLNVNIATGRLLLMVGAGRDNQSLHAYGKSLLGEAQGLLRKLESKGFILESATMIPDPDGQYNGPIVTNRDAFSFVDAAYQSSGTAHLPLSNQWGGVSG